MDKLSSEVWVFVEQNSGKPADVSFELLSKGRKLADTLKGTLKAVVIGHKMDDISKQTNVSIWDRRSVACGSS